MFSYDHKDDNPLDKIIKDFAGYEQKCAKKFLQSIGSMLSCTDKLTAYAADEDEILCVSNFFFMLRTILNDLRALNPDSTLVNNVQAAIVKRDNEVKNFLRELGDESKRTSAEIRKEKKIEFKHERSEEETNAIIGITQNLATLYEAYKNTKKKYRTQLHHYIDTLVASSERFKQTGNVDKELDCLNRIKECLIKAELLGFNFKERLILEEGVSERLRELKAKGPEI